MKNVISVLFAAGASFSFAQTTVPQNTPIHTILRSDIIGVERTNKIEGYANFIVDEDVIIGKNIVIAKGARISANAEIVSGKYSNLKVELLSVEAVDGSIIPLNDCWIYHMRQQNQKRGENTIVAGTRKNCSTAKTAIVNASSRL